MENEKLLRKLEIKNDTENPFNTKIFVDGKEISRCKSFTLKQDCYTPATCELELFVQPNAVCLPVDVQISSMEEIAYCMSEKDFERFKKIWNEIHSEDEENE